MNIITRAMAAICLVVAASSATAIGIVTPAATENVDGNINNVAPFSDFARYTRYQQIFAATDFAKVGGVARLTALSFRPDAAMPRAGSYAFSGALSLSTTSKGESGLLSNLSANVGSDAMTVFSGETTLTTASTLLGNGTYAFDFTFDFSTPFFYDPSKGNLLLDITFVANPSTPVILDASFVAGDGTSRAYHSSDRGFNSDTAGLVARFEVTAVPEPTSLVLFGLGIAALAALRGRRGSGAAVLERQSR